MDMKYIAYCFADPAFYDVARVGQATRQRRFELPRQVSWGAWGIEVSNGWCYVMPQEPNLVEQGWKIHVSATMENAQKILDAVALYCHRESISFKYLPTSAEMQRSNMKYAHRGGSGKFITIYPDSEQACSRILHELDDIIGGESGPYILSDIRFRNGPLYCRYGGFKPMYVRSDSDEMVPAIHHPQGQLVPDERQPVFRPPEWVTLPAFVQEQVDLLGSSARPEDFPYQVVEALHFSNGGGIYKAIPSEGGDAVVLKEARPFAGLGPDGRDAVERLRKEEDFLSRLSDVEAVVKLHHCFEAGGHHFLVEELIEGTTLNQEMVLRSPTIRGNATDDDFIEYKEWAVGLLSQIEEAVRLFHSREIVFGDLHPNNIIVTPDGRARFIDFEMAYEVGETNIAPAGAPGYVAEDGRTGVAADLYSLACMRLAMFLPLTVVLPLDSSKLASMVDQARQTFQLDEDYCHSIITDMDLPASTSHLSSGARRVRELRDNWAIDSPMHMTDIDRAIGRGIDDSVDLSRSDRVYPGDVRQFSEGGFGIATGAAGVLVAYPEAQRRDEVLDWIEDAAENPQQMSVGFFDGIAGAAWALARLDRPAAANRLYQRLASTDFSRLTSDMYSGLSGIGISMMDDALCQGEPRRHASSIAQIHDVMAERFGEDRSAMVRDVRGYATAAVGKGGLMWGMAGQAMFWLASYEFTRDTDDLDRADFVLRREVELLTPTSDGSLQLNEGWRVLPYIATGSMGVGLAIMRYLRNREDDGLVHVLQGIERNIVPPFAIQSNLFNGRAGFTMFIDRILDTPYAQVASLETLQREATRLGTHALVRRNGIVFPGEQLMRLSTDLSTGSAGVLAALRIYAKRCLGSERVEPAAFLLDCWSPQSSPHLSGIATTTEGR
ncbi:class III lanthionine synthetase LanKC [Luteococcus sp.]|uniref:class III lanthionine synthetase LanKC n=1 Tax=Luteococcus sp. TaxID=1969402 RepID=UPI0037361787